MVKYIRKVKPIIYQLNNHLIINIDDKVQTQYSSYRMNKNQTIFCIESYQKSCCCVFLSLITTIILTLRRIFLSGITITLFVTRRMTLQGCHPVFEQDLKGMDLNCVIQSKVISFRNRGLVSRGLLR